MNLVVVIKNELPEPGDPTVQKILLIAIFFLTISTKSQAIEQDKLLHFTTSYALTFTLSQLFQALGVEKGGANIGAGMTVLFAAGYKEFLDTPPDSADMIANGLGIGLAIGIDNLLGGGK